MPGLLLGLLGWLGTAFAAAPGAVDVLPLTQQVDHAGMEVRLEWSSPQGAGRLTPKSELELQLTLRDRATQLPLGAQRPRLWASYLTSAVAAHESCPDRTRRLSSGRLSARADVELSGFKLLALNNDRTVSVLDPQVRVGSTRLESLIQLPADGADWVLLEDRGWVAVTLPSLRSVALLDIQTQRVAAVIETGPKGEPRRLVRERGGSSKVWVGLDGSDEVVSIDLAARRVVDRITVGSGLHLLETAADGPWLFVTSSGSGDLAVIDAAAGRLLSRVAVGPGALGLAYSTASARAYVAATSGDEVAEVDPARGEVVRRLRVAPGIHALRADPSGRYVFALSERAGRAFVIDTATGTLLGGAPVAANPDQVVFSARFAYVRGLGSTKVSLVDLAALRTGKIEVTDVPMFRAPASSAAQNIQVADMIVPSPEGGGVIVAGTADAVLYSYAEGMMAPQGTFDNASRTPRGLLLLDRGLREVAPGQYRARFKLPRPGRYVIPLVVDQARWNHCVEVVVDGAVPEGQTQRVLMTHAEGEAPLQAGRATPLRVRLERENGGGPVTGLRDLQLMVLEMPGVWQQRQMAREVAPGVYEIEQRFPRAGIYQLSAGSATLGLGFGAKGKLRLRVLDSNAGAVPAAQDKS